MSFFKTLLLHSLFLIIILVNKNIQAQYSKDNLMLKGEEEILKRNYTGAILLLNQDIQKNPENNLSYFLRGLAKKELGDQIGAFDDFTTSINLHPGFSKAYYHRCIIKIDFKDFYNALTDINKAISYNVTNSDYYVARGYIYNILKDTTNAFHDFNTAIFLNATNSNAYLNKSLLEIDLKQYNKAYLSINKSISITSFNLNAFIIRGYIKLCNKDSLGAKDDYEFVITKDSTFILAYYNLALYFHKNNNFAKAIENYNKVISLNPYHSECYYNRAALYAENEKYVEAINDYNNVIKINPLNIYAYFNRAIVKNYLSDYANAMNDLSKVIELYPKFQKAYILRSNIHMQLKNYNAAEKDRKFANFLFNENADTTINKSDSIYLLPLIDFRSESQAFDTSQGRIQYQSFNINLKSIYKLIPDNEIKSIRKYNELIDKLNDYQFVNLKIRMDNIETQLSFDNIAESKILLDSLAPKLSQLNEKYFIWKSTLSGLLKNFREALQTLSQIPDTSEYTYLSSFLKGNLFMNLGEQAENIYFDNQFADNNLSSINNNYNFAIEEYSKSILGNNKFSYAYFNRGYAKSLINDIKGAIADYNSCLFFDKSFGEAYYNRGMLYIFIGDTQNGCLDFSKAGELGIKEAYSLLYKYCK